ASGRDEPHVDRPRYRPCDGADLPPRRADRGAARRGAAARAKLRRHPAAAGRADPPLFQAHIRMSRTRRTRIRELHMNRHALIFSLLLATAGCSTAQPLIVTAPRPAPAPRAPAPAPEAEPDRFPPSRDAGFPAPSAEARRIPEPVIPAE